MADSTPSRMQDSIGWAPLHLSLLSSCQDWPNVSAAHPQLSQIPACLACTEHGMLRPTNRLVGWVWGSMSKRQSTLLAPSVCLEARIRTDSVLYFCPLTFLKFFLTCWHLHWNMNVLQTWAVTTKHQLALCHPPRCFAIVCQARYHPDMLHCSAPLCSPVMGRGAQWANAN